MRSWNYVLAGTSTLGQLAVIVATLIRCRHNVPLRLIAVMHTSLTTMLGYLTFRMGFYAQSGQSSPSAARKPGDGSIQPGTMYAMTVYDDVDTMPSPTSTNLSARGRTSPWRNLRWQVPQVITLALGVAGVIIITIRAWSLSSVKIVSLVFYSIFGFINLAILAVHGSGIASTWLRRYGFCGEDAWFARSTYHVWFLTIALFAYCSDWLLGVLAEDVRGIRYGTTDNGLYWTFFLARLLPLLVF